MIGAVAAVDATRGVLAVRDRHIITLHRLTPPDTLDAVLLLLGPLRPAHTRTARVPVPVLTAALAAAGEDPDRLATELMRRGMTTPAARALVAANHHVDTVTRIGATIRTSTHDPRHRSPYLLTVQHTPTGHHLQRPHHGAPGHPDLLETTPATTDRLTREIDDLIRTTTPPARLTRPSRSPGTTDPVP